MAGRPANLGAIKAELVLDIKSAEKLIASVRTLEGISAKHLHPKHVRRVIELAFMGVVAAWEEFVERVFVRYLAGASAPSGLAPTLRAGKAISVAHAYRVVSQKPNFDPAKDYLKFSDPSWVLDQARFYFDAGEPFQCLGSSADLLNRASIIRNRTAHSSKKCREDFRATAIHFLHPPKEKLKQGYRAGDLLLSRAERHFGKAAAQKKLSIFDAYMALLQTLADKIVPIAKP